MTNHDRNLIIRMVYISIGMFLLTIILSLTSCRSSKQTTFSQSGESESDVRSISNIASSSVDTTSRHIEIVLDSFDLFLAPIVSMDSADYKPSPSGHQPYGIRLTAKKATITNNVEMKTQSSIESSSVIDSTSHSNIAVSSVSKTSSPHLGIWISSIIAILLIIIFISIYLKLTH